MGNGQEGTGSVTWQVEFTPKARLMLRAIKDRRVQQKISEVIESLAHEPEKRGKDLTDDLAGYKSIRAVGQRYRVIYRVEGDKVIVVVVAVGLRKEGSKQDVYKLAQRLVRLGLVEPPEEKE